MTDDEVWPPPPERRQAVEYKSMSIGGVQLTIDGDSLLVDFVQDRRMRLILASSFACIIIVRIAVWYVVTASWLQFSTSDLYDMLTVIACAAMWLDYDLIAHRGRFTINRSGSVTGGSTIPHHWSGPQYVRAGGKGTRSSINIGWPNKVAPIRWWRRSFYALPNEIMLTRTVHASTARRVAEIIGDFLNVPVH